MLCWCKRIPHLHTPCYITDVTALKVLTTDYYLTMHQFKTNQTVPLIWVFKESTSKLQIVILFPINKVIPYASSEMKGDILFTDILWRSQTQPLSGTYTIKLCINSKNKTFHVTFDICHECNTLLQDEIWTLKWILFIPSALGWTVLTWPAGCNTKASWFSLISVSVL